MPKMASRIVMAVQRTGEECSFKAVRFPTHFVKDEYIFECETRGCPGCGCPPFILDTEENFPSDTFQWLEDHAQMCLGLKPSTAPSPD